MGGEGEGRGGRPRIQILDVWKGNYLMMSAGYGGGCGGSHVGIIASYHQKCGVGSFVLYCSTNFKISQVAAD